MYHKVSNSYKKYLGSPPPRFLVVSVLLVFFVLFVFVLCLV